MRRLRILLYVLFVVVAGFFGYDQYTRRKDRDVVAPVIKADEEYIEVSIHSGQEELLKGMTASDDVDGDVTDSIVVVSRSKFLSRGLVKFNYAAFDSHNNVGTYTRRVRYTDYVSPHFSATQPFRFMNRSAYSVLSGVHANDILDGDISNKIRAITSNSNTGTNVTIEVTNSVGDTASVLVSLIADDAASYNTPAPALKTYIMYTTVNGSPDYRGNIRGIWRNGTTTDFAEMDEEATFTEDMIYVDDSSVDYYSAGTYLVAYTLQHNGIAYGSSYMYLIVEG